VPTIAAGAALGANQPTPSATNNTAPTPREKTLDVYFADDIARIAIVRNSVISAGARAAS